VPLPLLLLALLLALLVVSLTGSSPVAHATSSTTGTKSET
jgi:hypothetical protein